MNAALFERKEIPDTVPHVEYTLTEVGEKLAHLLEQLQELGLAHAHGLSHEESAPKA